MNNDEEAKKTLEAAEWRALTELAVAEFKFKAAQQKAKAVWATPQEWKELEKPE